MAQEPFIMLLTSVIDRLGYGESLSFVIRLLRERNYKTGELGVSVRQVMRETGWGWPRSQRVVQAAEECAKAAVHQTVHFRGRSGAANGAEKADNDGGSQTQAVRPTVHKRCTNGAGNGDPLYQDIQEEEKTHTPRAREAQPDLSSGSAIGISEGFRAFFNAYPATRRDRWATAWNVWISHGCEGQAEQVMEALRAFQSTPDWQRDGGRYVPGMVRWLESLPWEAPLPTTEESKPEDDPLGNW